MITNAWIERRKQGWSRLESLATQAETSGLKSLGTPDLRDLGLLYRQAAADLSAVRTDQGARTLEAYLNQLVSRAHNFVYSGQRLGWMSLWRFMAFEYPRVFRRLFPYVAIAFALFAVGAIVGMVLVWVRPETMYAALGPHMIDTIEHHKMWTDSILGAEPQSSSKIMTNNIMVCFISFFTGIVACIPTLWFMLFNGFNVGLIGTVCAQHGMGWNLLAFIASHGALELPAIFIAGGAGLRLGAGWLFPGYLRRRDSFARAGTESIRLVAGTVPMLFVAGILEGFLSPSAAPWPLKFSVSAVLLTALILWLRRGWQTPVTAE